MQQKSLKNIDDRSFKFTFTMTQRHKKFKNHSEWISNIKFTDLYNWKCIKHQNLINENDYTLLERKNLEITLVVLFVNVAVKPFIEKDEIKICIYKSMRKSYMSKNYDTKGHKAVFVISSWRHIINGKMINVENVGVNYYNQSKFEDKAMHSDN